MTDRQQMPTAVKTRRDPISLPFERVRTRWAQGGERIIGCVLLVFTLPLMAIIAIAIKCDSAGPVLHWRDRVRGGGRRQTFLNFRTTVADGAWTRAGQLTRVGQFLRYTRLEELPQLFDVLRGESRLTEFFDD
jgi:lipopolysaccharide/colanic/teichoic acid biosynthesis glycosyltransferase